MTSKKKRMTSSRRSSKKNVENDGAASLKSVAPQTAESSSASPIEVSTDFLSKEIGWLKFNGRVLHEALDSRNPLLERLKFLSISQSNLDEFFMKQVGGLKRKQALGIQSRSIDGKSPALLLGEIRTHVVEMISVQAFISEQKLKVALKDEQIFLLKWKDLSAEEILWAEKYYTRNVFPVLTPLSVDPGHPFPFISNLSTSLGVVLNQPGKEEKLFARVKVPQVLPQWIRLNLDSNRGSYRFISLLEMIRANVSDLFPEMKVLNTMPFRLTRNADIVRDEEESEDLLEMVEEELRLRRFAEVVRLEHAPNPDPWILNFLMDELELLDQDVYELSDELDYRGLSVIAEIDKPTLRFPPWTPVVPTPFEEKDANHIFAMIRKSDHLLHHPYESFSATVERLIRVSAEDPKVLAIKMTLYRTGDHSAFVSALIRAAEAGKQVVCLVELKARFDEERNIHWAQELEAAGVHVVYGVVGLKTHGKTTLIVRQEQDGIRCYAHIGTGNYNATTSRFYTDLGLLTCREEVTGELVEFFHYLTGRSMKSDYEHLLVAPVNMKKRFLELIRREADHAKAGRPSGIFTKVNNFDEVEIGKALIHASQAGVQIDLVIRGFSCLRPGIKGKSETIRIISVIGRFLEHSRIFYFRNGAADPIDGDFFIGSADWMGRNMHVRVECIVPIMDRILRKRIWEIIQMYLHDQRQTWEMTPNGHYEQRTKASEGVQSKLMSLARQGSISNELDWNRDLP